MRVKPKESVRSTARPATRPAKERAAGAAGEAVTWSPDVLGAAYQCSVIRLPDEADGELSATLVRRRASRPDGRAVLYLHGYSDYFFQTHLADYFVARGIDFYALDLRRHGRSLRPHHTPNYVTDLADYFVELDAAIAIMRADGARRIVVNAHSTGGLVAALWAHRNRAHAPGAGGIEGLMLNSPWFDVDDPLPVRLLASPLVEVLSRLLPQTVLPLRVGDHYGRSLHRDHQGEWTFDLSVKPLGGFPVRAGWLRAVLRGHRRLHAGLQVGCPILVLCSSRSVPRGSAGHLLSHADAVINVDQTARWSVALGPQVTIRRIEDGIHDLVLSPPPVRERVYQEMSTWLDLHFMTESTSTPGSRQDSD
ncbi:MAG: alpha/beta hydrolase [Micromonosporaceae bacterium]